MNKPESHRFSSDEIHRYCSEVFQTFGVPEDDAELAADVLRLADLRGIDSHGVARMKAYHSLLAANSLNPKPKLKIVRETPSTATVDGDNGLGLVVGPKANQIAMEKAENVGTGWVAICNTNHFGIAGYYVLEALKRDMIGWSMTNTTRIMAPLWGADRMLGTNPLAIAFPGKNEPPVVIDLATTSAAFGKVEIAIRTNTNLPQGWAIDKNGNPTTDPHEMVDGGAMLPLGSTREQGGHKGYCLGAMVDLLCGPLSGANWGPFTPPFTIEHAQPERSVGKGLGHFFGAMKIGAFIDPDEFKTQVDDWIQTMRSTRPVPGTDGPLIPGDPERESEKNRKTEGIPLVEAVIQDLQEISAATGVRLPQ